MKLHCLLAQKKEEVYTLHTHTHTQNLKNLSEARVNVSTELHCQGLLAQKKKKG
jgi:hypothetical protein